jgi:hypothetical protein
MRERRGAYRALVGILTEREGLEDLDTDGSKVLICISMKLLAGRGLHLAGSGWGQREGCCDHGNEHSGSVTTRGIS